MNYISLGYFCSPAIELQRFGLRTESSPFDWCISDFQGVILAIQNGFTGFMEQDSLLQNKNFPAYYRNKYGIQFLHDFNAYESLEQQFLLVKAKYNRRIQRFYQTITSPTLFIRYISDENKVDGRSEELIWIEHNLDMILGTIKGFHEENDILFIANDGVTSDKLSIYNVSKDEGDLVARNPISKHEELNQMFLNIELEGKQENIQRYRKQESRRNSLSYRMKKKMSILFQKEYIHYNQY